jgi:glycerol-3-phosphate dehydrogenase (NAD(P)+)
MDIAILGAGAWGSALAVSWSSTHRVRLWTRARVDADSLARTRSSRYLPGITIPASVTIVGEIEAAVARAELVVVATSTAGLRETATRVHAIDRSPTIAWACKGFESATSLLPHQVVAQALPEARRAGALSGPSFALEVAKGFADRGGIRRRRPALRACHRGRVETVRGFASIPATTFRAWSWAVR